MDPQARQRKGDLRLMFNALRWTARAGASWRWIPHEFPPWEAVYQQTQRWLQAGRGRNSVRRHLPWLGVTSWGPL
jgi:transposase